jgi:DNA mismatch repair protein MSH2
LIGIYRRALLLPNYAPAEHIFTNLFLCFFVCFFISLDLHSLLDDARSGWASFADVKVERNGHQGVVFRTPRADDERQLRTNNKTVQIVSIQKSGLYFTVPALKRIADRTKIVTAQYAKVQQVVVAKVIETARTFVGLIEAAAALVAELDVFASFATAAALAPVEYVRPKIHPMGTGILKITAGRHPCVELMDGVEFIANDCFLDRNATNFQIITGPNMGGKSTYIRGVGCIQVMAQVGSFVPCGEAEVSVADVLLARVGAGDAVQKGVSTFMAEMLEAAVILQTATENSLIIIDELGRGTSTFDGFGLAWAISEYIVSKTKASTLFATHFFELTNMSSQHPTVANRHVTAFTEENQVVMLHSVADGPCSESFGIHVAKMAQFPNAVIEGAKRKVIELEKSEQLNHVDSTEQVEKRRRVDAAIDTFSSKDVPAILAADVVPFLKELIQNNNN